MSGEVRREWLDHDYYKVLGVDASASQSEITKAYRKLARAHHPDANPGDQAAEDTFKEISAAYDVVGDESTRAEYDKVRQLGAFGGGFAGAGGPGGFGGFSTDDMGDLSGLLGQMFGGGLFGGAAGGPGGPRPRPGRDQEAHLTISFDEAVQGTTTSLSLTDPGGSRTMKVRIPAGVTSGQRIRLRGKGGAGSPPGDLFVVVSVGDHPVFGRDGQRLVLDVPITIAEAALGADVEVPTYTGGSVTVRVPAGTQHGRTMRVRGAGVAGTDGADPGDLFVNLVVAVPTNLSAVERRHLEAFAAEHDESPRRHLFAERSTG